jgi:LysM repeat protein
VSAGGGEGTAAALPAIVELSTSRWVVHPVAPRETLVQIAARYGVTPDAIRAWNEELGSEAEKGTKLKIRARRVSPPRTLVMHSVATDDTWWTIATRYGVESFDLKSWNYRKGGALRPGEELRVWADPVIRGAIERDGDTAEIRAGGYGIGSPDDGRIVNAVQLPADPAWDRKRPSSAWGTTHAIRSLVAALRAFRSSTPYAGRIVIGAISRPRGGTLGSHKSHQTGRDVDIRLPLKIEVPQSLAPKPARRVDFVALWHLVRAIAATGEATHVFLDYRLQRRLHAAALQAGASAAEVEDLLQWPRGRGASRGLVRDEPGHDDHIHVRFRCGPAEPECIAGDRAYESDRGAE